MAELIEHQFTLPLHANPENLDPCVNSKWIALPISRTVIGLWKHSQRAGMVKNPIELCGHSKTITALVFRRQRQDCLATACANKVLLWNLGDSSDVISNETFYANPGQVTAMTFNNAGTIIAAGVENRILLLTSKQREPLAVFDIHNAPVTGVDFCPHYSATLISISDDRSFCVWDTNELILLYQSTIISSAPLLCMSMNWVIPQVSFGSSDGKIRVFDLTDGNNFRQLISLDVSQNLKKHFEKQRSDAAPYGPVHVTKKGKAQATNRSQASGENIVESNESVVAVQYAYFSRSNSFSSTDALGTSASGASDIVSKTAPALCVVSSNSIIQINSNTFEIQSVIDLHNPIYSYSFSGQCTIGAISYAALHQTGPINMSVVTGSLFERKINVLHWCIDSGESNGSPLGISLDCECDEGKEKELSIVADTTLLPSSPLKSEMLPPTVSKAPTKGDIATGKVKPTSSMNQPLTFKSKVKSSGYTQAPRTTMFKPETSKKKLLNLDSSTEKLKGKSVAGKLVKSEYNTSSGPPCELCDSFDVERSSTAILNLRFSNDGSSLGCALSNKGALTVKSPYSKHKCIAYVGHNNIVNSVYFSGDGELLLTASNDKTISVWDKAGGDPIMTLSHQSGTLKEQQNKGNASLHSGSSGTQIKSGATNVTSQQGKPFSKEIKYAQFYYMDKFILLANGPELMLYKYHVSNERDEIKRYQSKNSCRLVASWQTQSTSINTFAAVNTFFSHLVVCATSGKNLEIYDLNKSVLAHSFENCHTRPAYFISINEGSRYSSQPPEAHNVIASVAQTDAVKIWDVRTKRSVQTLQGHSNGAYACQIAFSPCGNYLASGSEDKVVYMYDLRMGTFCERLRGHNEVISSVAFHPAQPLLVSGGVNGKLIFFKPK